MLPKCVPGFCTEVLDACKIFGVSLDDFIGTNDVRDKLKIKLIELQGIELYRRMMLCSKMDKIILNGFKYDGKIQKYLIELDFEHARAIFMVRFRMLPTKSNFPGRWSGNTCNICSFEDTDAHLFVCPGYQDLISDDISYDMFWNDICLNNIEQLKAAACILVAVIERIEQIQSMVK